LDELNIEIIRNTLYKAYLEDFYDFCQKIGGPTAEIMGDILQVGERKLINTYQYNITLLTLPSSLKPIDALSTSQSTLSVPSFPKRIEKNYIQALVDCSQKEMLPLQQPMILIK
jgi:hypothetical protein